MRLNVVFDVWIKVGGDKGVGLHRQLAEDQLPSKKVEDKTVVVYHLHTAMYTCCSKGGVWEAKQVAATVCDFQASLEADFVILTESDVMFGGILHCSCKSSMYKKVKVTMSQQFPNWGTPFSISSVQLLHSALHKNISSGKTLKTNVEVHSCIEQNSEVSVFRLLLALWYMRRSKTITTWSEESAIGGGGKVHALKQHKNGICSANFAHPGHLGALLRHFCTYLQRVFQLWLGFLEGSIFLSRQQWQEPVWGRELASSFLNRSTWTQPKPSLNSEKAA